MTRNKTLLTLVVAAMIGFVATSANAVVVPVTDVYGHNEKDNYDGKINDMFIGSGMNDYGVDGNPGWPTGEGDPTTWTATSNAYQAEWQSQDLLVADSGDLDPNGTPLGEGVGPTNGKIGWTVFDLGASTADLENLYIWHIRERDDRVAAEFNVYVADSPTATLPHGPTNNISIDYDFSSGGWTQVNGSVLNGTWRGDQVVSLNDNTGRYVGVEILSNDGDANRVGLAEVGITASGGGSSFIDGDYNSSNLVEQGDLDLVLLNWGDPASPAPDGWTNPDFQPIAPIIDQGELDGVLLNWGNTNPPAVAAAGVVPEPASACLLLIGGLWLGRLRRHG